MNKIHLSKITLLFIVLTVSMQAKSQIVGHLTSELDNFKDYSFEKNEGPLSIYSLDVKTATHLFKTQIGCYDKLIIQFIYGVGTKSNAQKDVDFVNDAYLNAINSSERRKGIISHEKIDIYEDKYTYNDVEIIITYTPNDGKPVFVIASTLKSKK